MEGDENESDIVLSITPEINLSDQQAFYRVCIDSESQLTAVGMQQVKKYCRNFGTDIKTKTSQKMYRFGNR